MGLIAEMENRAEIAPDVALTIENWDKLFADGKVNTPIGEVKMGENQFTKLTRQGREGKLGMVKPTLENPDVIIEDASEAKEGDVTERGSSYVFVKAFKKADGSRYYYFTSVTVSKDGKEVVISNQEKRKNAIANLLSNGKLVWKHADDVSAVSDVEQGLYSSQGNMSDPTTEGTDAPQTNVSSASKVTNNSANVQENEQKNEKLLDFDEIEALKDAPRYVRTAIWDNATKAYNDALAKVNPFQFGIPEEKQERMTFEKFRDEFKEIAGTFARGTDDYLPAVYEYMSKRLDIKAQEKIKQDKAIQIAEQETNTNPTEAQKEAGNYKKGHVKIDGFDITIENPKGSERSGTDASGKKWSITMQNTYGYIRGTEGVDGDHIDVFLSDDPSQGDVFVVDQVNKDGSFDEHKVMYGFSDIESARKAYLSNYEEGWQGLGAITPVSKEEFKKWINSSHRKTKPFAEYSSVKPLEENKKVTEESLKQFIGDWEKDPENATKVVDEKGQPIVVYRGGGRLGNIEDDHNNTLYIELSTDNSYWSVNSGGVFRRNYGNNKEEVWSASEEQNKQSATDNTLQATDKSDNPVTSNGNVSNTSASKVTNNSANVQEKEQENAILRLEGYSEEEIVSAIHEDIEAVNEKFNKELDDFKEKKHQGLMHLGNPLEILRACGVNAKNLTLSPTVLHRHLKEHGLTVEDLKGLAKAVQTPILVYAHGKNHPNMVVVTEMDVKGGKFSVSLELDKDGNVVEISNIRSIHSKDAMIKMERLSEFSEEELKEA
ncbi:MAG: hypothetical protein K6A78_07385 [Prevotella sp.]|nr:hypothetical protein [Prevotella sp.]